MANIAMTKYQQLEAMGRPPISRPAEINFGGSEELQRAHCDTPECEDGKCTCGKGMHHLPQYQKTGTYMHPALVQERLRVAGDRVERFKKLTMSEPERRKYAPNGMKSLKDALAVAQKEYMDVIGGEQSKKLSELSKMVESAPSPQVSSAPVAEALKEPEPIVQAKPRGRPKKQAEEAPLEDFEGPSIVDRAAAAISSRSTMDLSSSHVTEIL